MGRYTCPPGIYPPGPDRKKVTADHAHALLLALLPNDPQTIYNFHKALLRHGQRVCVFERPRCEKCILTDLCDYYKTVVKPH